MKLQHVSLALAAAATAQQCPAYESYAARRNPPFSPGRYAYPSQRPPRPCRTYVAAEVDKTLDEARARIGDQDLYRLFVNAWPNTVDTTVLWRGVSAHDAEEQLAFITTGDIHAMWLRDSANQLQSYKRLLSPRNTTSAIATLYRGAINLQARYIRQFPHCNAFQPPPESKMPPVAATAERADVVSPPYDPGVVFECKYELDSLAAFLQLSWDYYDATHDAAFFARFHWAAAVRSILRLARDMMQGTYADDGTVNPSPYTWLRDATSATETVSNGGAGNPVAGRLGLVRSFFRPSDDSTIYQYLVPSNIMFSRFLAACAVIMRPIDAGLATEMKAMADGIAAGLETHAVVHHPQFGHVYAYEVDGFGSSNLMDDANIPSLLSIPHLGFKPASDPLYRRTRDLVLSRSNPYFARGPVLNATGGPHLGPGMAWPMAVIMQTMTSDDDDEIVRGIKQLMGSTSGLGLIHESVNSHDASKWTRPWFAWANGLFGQMVLDLLDRKPQLLGRSFQH
ncbi:hypothetical protein G6O67_008136 [Ophiocordyceps sinensis]|uniref:Six-hairpin glycosidase n=1 Tax=Ophiocordyceps sinensis TaxID=72228 RepID=A0A8H4PGV1_9HYPO|nr:hypothetical protein G6O67_008136 [Ophiocordyceps sinensis]